MKTKLAAFAASGFVAATLLAGCGSELDRDGFVSQLTDETPATEEQANCIADAVEEAGIPFNDLTEDNITPELEAQVGDLMFDCLIG
jgi:uncharacterized protein YabE (DUF348 family)